MAFDAHSNGGYSTVLTAPSPASSGTSLVVQASDGTRFPATPFNAIVWPAGTQPLYANGANAEVVRVTAISTDTFTITRAQETSSARAIVVGDQIAAAETAKTFTDIENLFPTGTVVGTTDTQTLTNKIVSDTFTGDVYDNQSAIKESLVLPASTDYLATQGVDISGSNGLEIPATSSLEVSSFYDPSSKIPTTKTQVMYAFFMYRAAALTSSSSFTRVAMDTILYDLGNNCDVITNQGRFLAPFTGLYLFSGSAGNTLATATQMGTALYKNNAQAAVGGFGDPSAATGSGNKYHVGGVPLQLLAGDYAELFFIGGNGSAMEVGQGACWFAGTMLARYN